MKNDEARLTDKFQRMMKECRPGDLVVYDERMRDVYRFTSEEAEVAFAAIADHHLSIVEALLR